MVLFVKRVGVLGGGVMGSQIADIMALNGKEVIIRDISEEAVNNSYSQIEKNLSDLVTFHLERADKEIERIEKTDGIKLTDDQKSTIKETLKPKFNQKMKEETLARVKTTTDIDDFKDVDLVIEAIVENI